MNRLFILRHAIAEEREDFAKTGRPDEERPLTPAGRERLEQVCRRIAGARLGITTVVQSPLTRSRQTAEVLARHLKKVELTTFESLRPESQLADLVRDLKKLGEGRPVIIGHEDHLSRFAMYLLTGGERGDFMKFKKAGMGSFTYEGPLTAGQAQLEWLLTPKLALAL